MSLQEKISNIKDFENLITSGSGITRFRVDQGGRGGSAFTQQLSMSYRDLSKIGSFFKLGPTRNSLVLTPNETWNIGISLEAVRKNIKKKGLYGFLVYMQNEGGSVWVLTPDSKIEITEEKDPLGDIINNDIKSKLWNSAFEKAAKETKIQNPFAVSYVGSVTCQRIPFFGRTVYGTAMVNGVISLVQIPLMGNNKDDYFSWLYVPKNGDLTPDDWENKTHGGGKTYNGFKEIRDYLLKECEPLNNSGSYADFNPKDRKTKQDQELEDQEPEDQKNNNNQDGNNQDTKDQNNNDTSNSNNSPTGNLLIDQATGNSQNTDKKESCIIKEALHKAKSFISEIYLMEDRRGSRSSDDDDEWYKGNPFENELNMQNGIPKFGPLY